MQRFKQLFTLQGAVSREHYVTVGLVLMLLKYAGEAGVILLHTGQAYEVWDFLSPLLSAREKYLEAGPAWLGFAWVVWTIPFVWIAIAMSYRRALDAKVSPWVAAWMLVPFFNFLFMFTLALVPTGYGARRLYKTYQSEEAWVLDRRAESRSESLSKVPPGEDRKSRIESSAGGLAIGAIYFIALMVLSVYGLDSYGASLFFGTPLVAGAATGYFYNRGQRQTLGETLSLATAASLAICLMFLLLGLEGLICIFMAVPIVWPLMMLGAAAGRAVAIEREATAQQRDRGMLSCLIVLPLLAGIEPHVIDKPEYLAMTQVEIDASPATVWQQVIAFPPIVTPEPWYFRWGVASPREATIQGEGVGATRYCKFTTGEFVEPITVWDEPRRLAFDVTEQPHPMFELSPYRHLHPPHLEGAFRSTRGEFLLVELPDGRTRLEGRTWYQIDMGPQTYWKWWTDGIVHRIHLRVLEHIKQVSESTK